ncbi:MAG: cyanophycinase [Clostridia bacterium]|nr:cyanophycinase [Clostridia bacterium]
MKRIIVILSMLILLIGCNQNEEIYRSKEGQFVTDLKIVTKGKFIDDFQLGFYPPVEMENPGEDFVGWLLLYDHESFDTVWEALNKLTTEEIMKLSDLNDENRGYFIEKFQWADGLGNTLNPAQKTFMGKEAFGLGVYHFYVATISDKGVIGLMEANEKIEVKPVPQKITFHQEENNYSVNYEIQKHDDLKGHVMFISTENLYVMKDEVKNMTLKTLEKKEKSKACILVNDQVNHITFDNTLKTFEENNIEKDVYNVYVGSYDANGVMDIAMANTYLVTSDNLSKPTEVLNDGIGTLMLIGGGVASSDVNNTSIFEAMRSATGKKLPRITILSSSRVDSLEVYNHFYFKDPEFSSFEENYKLLGFEPIFIPLATDNAEAIKNHAYWVSLLESCDAVYLQGGDQYKHVKSLLNSDGTPSKMLLAMQNILDRGGVIAGTSAGMAAMGDYAFGLGSSYEALNYNQTEFYSYEDLFLNEEMSSKLGDNNIVTSGIGLLDPSVIVDTHFDARGRLGRLLVAMKDTQSTFGVGVDEKTSLSIQNKIGEVIGEVGVFIIDQSEANYDASVENFQVDHLILHYLTSGDRYDFWTKRVLEGNNKTMIEVSEPLNTSYKIFDPAYETTKLLLDFMASSDQVMEIVYPLENGIVLRFTLEKTEQTKAYTSDEKYNGSDLSQYNKCTIESLSLSVTAYEGKDTTAPVISYMKGYTKAYKVYLGITDDLSGVDPGTVNDMTVEFQSDMNTLYEPPFYDEAYKEIGIIIAEDAFTKGDRVIVKGVKDYDGNEVQSQTWLFDGSQWLKEE